MKEKLLSIIVPIYNAEADLKRCLDSLLAQTYQSLEIILIDDGSTDGSFAVCQAYAQSNASICCYHQPNGGVSSARNKGLSMAHGEIIGFCDADDWVDADYYARMVSLMQEHDAQMVFSGYEEFFEKSGASRLHHPAKSGLVDGYEALKQCVLPQRDGYFTSLWNKLFQREMLLDEAGKLFTFPPDIAVGEDETLLVQCCPKARRVFLCPEGGYHWLVRDGSACHSVRVTERAVSGITGKERCVAYGEAHHYPPELLQLMKARIFRENIHLLVMARYTEDRQVYRALRKRICAGLPAMLKMPQHSPQFKLRLLVLLCCLTLRVPLSVTERIEYYNAM